MQPKATPRSGMITLDSLYKFVRTNAPRADEAYRLRTELGKGYSTLCNDLTKEIPDCPGLYIWGRYDGRRYWHNLYFGMAGFSAEKKNLRKRILEELKDERAFLWRHEVDSRKLQQLREGVLKERGIEGDPYHLGFQRALKKRGALNIIWLEVSDPALKDIEPDMTEALNPMADIRRPAPSNHVQPSATRVFERIRAMIHDNRPKHASGLQHEVDRALQSE